MHENFKRTGEEKEEKETFTLIPHVYRCTGIHVKIKNVGQFDIDMYVYRYIHTCVLI